MNVIYENKKKRRHLENKNNDVKMSNTLVIGYCDGAEYVIRYFKQVISHLLRRENMQIEWKKDPVSTPHLLIHSLFGQNHQKYTCPKLCFSGEPQDLSHLSAALLLDCKNLASHRPLHVPFFYLPFYVVSFFERVKNSPTQMIRSIDFRAADVRLTKTKFCAFLYAHDVPFRNELFQMIGKYKPVDALGKCGQKKLAAGTIIDRAAYNMKSETFYDLAVEKYRPYKFVICCENTLQPGYITEKIVNAYLAHAIPIYMGAPDIAQHFNPKSMIHVGDVNELSEVIERIRQVDENDALYDAMLQEPPLVGNQFTSYFRLNYAATPLRQWLQLAGLNVCV